VSSGHNIHPEFGYFCPAPRLRREMRVALCAVIFGAAIGAISVLALSPSDRPSSSASATRANGTQARLEPNESYGGKNAPGFQSTGASSNHEVETGSSNRATVAWPSLDSKEVKTIGIQGCEDPRLRSSQGECLSDKLHSRRPPADNGPDLARVPLGRAVALDNATATTGGPDSALEASKVSTPSAVAQAPATISAPPRTGSARPHSASVAAERTHKIVRAQSRRHKQQSERAIVGTWGVDTRAWSFDDAYARDNSFPRTVFWDWSR